MIPKRISFGRGEGGRPIGILAMQALQTLLRLVDANVLGGALDGFIEKIASVQANLERRDEAKTLLDEAQAAQAKARAVKLLAEAAKTFDPQRKRPRLTPQQAEEGVAKASKKLAAKGSDVSVSRRELTRRTQAKEATTIAGQQVESEVKRLSKRILLPDGSKKRGN